MADVNYTILLIAALVAVASPGPATLAIAEASMSRGRRFSAMLAFGITTGSMFWSVSAAVGLSALMMTQAWLFEWVRYLGISYLLYLAWRSARSAWYPKAKPELSETPKLISFKAAYLRGLGIHLTNPKAILFFGSLYSLGIPDQTSVQQIAIVNLLIVTQGFCVFQLYAYLFSMERVRESYTRLRRVFESLFAMFFGAASLSLIWVKLD